jgi:hypothetical protein
MIYGDCATRCSKSWFPGDFNLKCAAQCENHANCGASSVFLVGGMILLTAVLVLAVIFTDGGN